MLSMLRTLDESCFRAGTLLFCAWFISSPLFAQNYSFDARNISLGGVSNIGSGNIVFKNIPQKFEYSSIVIPLGVMQIVQDMDVFNPDKEEFDLVRVIDYAGNPLHYTLDRSKGKGEFDFLDDLRNGEMSRDLNDYRGFTPPRTFLAEGLVAPSWGHTFKFLQRGNESFHGIYVGAGPYLSVSTDLDFDQRLIDILGSSSPVSIPQDSYRILNDSTGQAALAITGGYRLKLGASDWMGSSSSDRNGIYFAANYHYLRGFRYDALDFNVRIDTDSDGLISLPSVTTSQILLFLTPELLQQFPPGVIEQLSPQEVVELIPELLDQLPPDLVDQLTPVVIEQLTSRSGRGFALDFGAGIVHDNWELGFGANGVGNRIKWEEFKLVFWSTLCRQTSGPAASM